MDVRASQRVHDGRVIRKRVLRALRVPYLLEQDVGGVFRYGLVEIGRKERILGRSYRGKALPVVHVDGFRGIRYRVQSYVRSVEVILVRYPGNESGRINHLQFRFLPLFQVIPVEADEIETDEVGRLGVFLRSRHGLERVVREIFRPVEITIFLNLEIRPVDGGILYGKAPYPVVRIDLYRVAQFPFQCCQR